MFQIVCDPSSGGTELCLTEITRGGSQITLPNTNQAHDEHLWTATSNFSEVQLYTPWWWIAYDPKHGVIFNFMSFKLLYNIDFNLLSFV